MNNMKNQKSTIGLVLVLIMLTFAPIASVLADPNGTIDNSGPGDEDTPIEEPVEEGVYLELEVGDSITVDGKTLTVVSMSLTEDAATFDVDGEEAYVVEHESETINGLVVELLDTNADPISVDIRAYLVGQEPVSPSTALVDLELSPTTQEADEDGLAIYKLVITDNHERPVSTGGISEIPLYYYELEGTSGNEGDLEYSFQDGPAVTVEAGETVVKEFKAQASEEGTYKVIVSLEGDGVQAEVHGALVFGSSNPIPEPSHPIPGQGDKLLFQGQGFILSEDEIEGYRIDLALLNVNGQEQVTGKITIGKERYMIEGSYSGDKVNFELFQFGFQPVNVGQEPIQGNPAIASFSGTIDEFDRFKLVRGTLSDFKGQNWKLTAMSHSQGVIVPVQMGKAKAVRAARAQDVLAVSTASEASEEDFYVKPIKIKERKLLWVFPTGENELEVEITQGEATFRKKIREHREARINGYKISVGPLVDEENIEIGIEKAE